MKKPELLAPAGSFEKAKTAFLYGADAVYAGTAELSLRSRVDVNDNELIKTIDRYCTDKGYTYYASDKLELLAPGQKKGSQIIDSSKE